MNFQQHVEERLDNVSARLGLTPLCKEILKILAMVDCKDALTEELRKADAYDRPGVLSWKTLAEQVPSTQATLLPLERAVLTLADWGLVQIVGRGIQDPVTPGPSALRLTYCGRVCIGLPSIGLTQQPKICTQKMQLENRSFSIQRTVASPMWNLVKGRAKTPFGRSKRKRCRH